MSYEPCKPTWRTFMTYLPDLPIWPTTFLYKTFSSIQTLCRAVSQFLRCLNFWIKVWKRTDPLPPRLWKPIIWMRFFKDGFPSKLVTLSDPSRIFNLWSFQKYISFYVYFSKVYFANNFPTISDIGNRRCLCKNFLPGVNFFPTLNATSRISTV